MGSLEVDLYALEDDKWVLIDDREFDVSLSRSGAVPEQIGWLVGGWQSITRFDSDRLVLSGVDRSGHFCALVLDHSGHSPVVDLQLW